MSAKLQAPSLAEWGFVVDASRWPLVRVRAPAVTDDAGVTAFLQELERQHERGAFGLICELPRLALPTASHRRLMADQRRHLQRRFPGVLRCMALVTPGKLTALEGVLRAIAWLAPPAQPNRVFNDVDKALAWCAGHLRPDGAAQRADPTR